MSFKEGQAMDQKSCKNCVADCPASGCDMEFLGCEDYTEEAEREEKA